MFDTIILLTGAAEQTALASVLRGHRPQLTIHPITTPEDLATIDGDVLRRARLIAFTTPVIVPLNVLSALGFGAYNFHPGPPEYPGWAPAHFALYEGGPRNSAPRPMRWPNASTPARSSTFPTSRFHPIWMSLPWKG